MDWFVLTQILSTLIQLIRIGRKSDQEKDLNIITLRYQLDKAVGIGQTIPCQPVSRAKPQKGGELISRPVLGGLHHDYYWQSHERPSFRRAA